MKDFDWRILTTLYNTKSLTKTAELLFTSQPNVTKRLKGMEQELSVQVVVRTAKGVTFTPQGEYLARRAAEILSLIDETKENVRGIADSPTGTIRLAAPNSFVRNELPAILQHYRQKPQIAFQLVTRLSDDIPRLVESGEIDVGFTHGDVADGLCKYRYLSEVLNIVSRNAITIDALPDLPQVDFVRSASTQRVIQAWWQRRFGVPQNVALQVNTGDICLEIVRKGIGFGFFFGTSYFKQEDDLCGLIAVDEDGIPVKRDTWLIYSKRNFERSVVRSFVDFILNEHKRL